METFAGDEAICRLVETYSDMLLHLACTRLNSTADAEDAVQEVFLRLLTARPRFRDAEHEKAWLIRATLHRAADLRRAAHNRDVPLTDTLPAYPPEEDNGVLAAVRALPEAYSTVIHLHYYEGYTIQEIAKLLGLPAATVGTRLRRGRERLRRLLEDAP